MHDKRTISIAMGTLGTILLLAGVAHGQEGWEIRKGGSGKGGKGAAARTSGEGSAKSEGRDDRAEETLAAYRKLLESDPREGYVLDKVLELAPRAGGVPALVAEYEARAKASPKDVTSRIIVGHLRKASGEPEQAIAAYEEAAALAPKDPLPLLSMGDAWRAMQRWDEALSAMEGALERTSGRQDKQALLKTIARTAFAAGRAERGRAALDALVGTDPGNLYLRMDVAQELSKQDMADEAIAAWEEVERRAGGDRQAKVTAARERAALLERQGKDDEALVLYRQALEVAPRGTGADRELRERIVALYRKQGRLAELIEEYEPKAQRDYELLALVGRLYEEVGDDAGALDSYRKAVRMQPRSLEARKAVIDLLERIGTTDDVIAEYKAIVKLAPREPGFELKLAELYQRKGDRAKALSVLHGISRKYPSDPSVHSTLVDYYIRFGADPGDVEGELKKLRQLEPKEESHVLGLGEFYFGRNEVDRAKGVWKKLLTVLPDEARAHFRLGETYAEHDMVDLAEKELQRALELKPRSRKYLKRYAQFLESQQRWDAAVHAWGRIIQLAGDDKEQVREGRRHIIALYAQSGRLKGKLVALREELLQTPPDVEAGYFLAEGLLFLKDYRAAEQIYDKLLEIDPSDVEAMLALESVLVKRSDLGRAMELARKLAEIDEAHRTSHLARVAEYAMQMGEEGDALSTSKRLVDLSPANPSAHAKLADIYRQTGDFEGAMREYKKAIDLGQRDYRVHFRLARIYHDLDRFDDEDQVLRRVLRESDDTAAVLKAGQRLIQINAYLGRLRNLEDELLPLVFSREQKYVYRRLLVDLYHRTSRELSYRLQVDSSDREAREELRGLADRGLKPLLDALAEDDVSIRTKAVEVLRDTRSPNAVLPLVRLLDGTDPELRFQAAVALAFGGSEAAVSALARLVDEPDDRLREVSVWALGAVQSHASLAPLEKVALHHDSAKMRAMGCLALGARGSRDAEPVLLRALGDSQAVVRQHAAWALGVSGDEAVIELLADRLRNDVPEVQRVIVWALGRIAAPSAMRPLVRQIWTNDLHEPGLLAWAVRRVARGAPERGRELSRDRELYLGFARFREADLRLAHGIERLTTEVVDIDVGGAAELVASFEEPIREEALELLGRDDGPTLRAVLVALDGSPVDPDLRMGLVLDVPSPEGRRRAQAALGRVLAPALPRLARLAVAEDPHVREPALRVMGKVASHAENIPPEVGQAVAAGLRADDVAVREAALFAAGLVGHPELVDAVLTAVSDPLAASSWGLRVAGAEALGRIGDSRALERLRAFAKDPFGLVRVQAVEAVAAVGGAAATPDLVAALRDGDPQVLLAAVRALGRLGDASATAPLQALRKTAPVAVTSAIDDALDAIGARK